MVKTFLLVMSLASSQGGAGIESVIFYDWAECQEAARDFYNNNKRLTPITYVSAYCSPRSEPDKNTNSVSIKSE